MARRKKFDDVHGWIVLDKLAAKLRPVEVEAKRAARTSR